MKLTDAFDVSAPPESVWGLLKDVPRVAPCIPNAKLTEVVDATTYKATVGVKVGPVSVSYKTTITVVEMDDAAHRAVLKVAGNEAQGRGGVSATVTAVVTPAGDGSHVTLDTDANVSGIIATVGGRLIEGVAKKTTGEFARNIATALGAAP